MTAAHALLPLMALAGGACGATECRVQDAGGVPTFVINGAPHTGVCYSTYDVSPESFGRRVRQFAEAGCDIVNFVVEISGYGFSPPMWVGPDEWDFAPLEDRVRIVLAAAPNAYLLPRVYIGEPEWWREANPEELMVLDNGATDFGEKLFAMPRSGGFASLASRKWRADMSHALEVVIDHIERSPYADRVIGYQISGQKTEEWYHFSMNCDRLGDYGAPMQAAFQQWLRERYANDDGLRAAWHRDGMTLASAEIPSRSERVGDRSRTFRDPSVDMNVIDFHRFWSDIMADTIDHFASVVKRRTHGSKVVGAFYAYTFEFAELGEDAGHLAVGRLLRSPSIDFLMAPSSYFDRNLPGKPYFRAPVASFVHHGKLFWNDFDQVSFKYYDKLKDDPNLATWEYQMGLTKTPEEFVWMCRREIGMTLAAGVQTAHFDIHGGYYEDPLIMAGVSRLREVRERALQMGERGSCAQILLVADEDSPHFARFRYPADTPADLLRRLLSDQVAEMDFVAPYDTALLSDLATMDLSRCRLVVMLDALKLDAEQRHLLDTRLKRDGRTVVWLYAPGYTDGERCDTGLIEQVTGIRMKHAPRGDGGQAGYIGAYAGYAEPEPLMREELFAVSDPRAQPLAVRVGDRTTVVMARRRFGEWTSVFAAFAPVRAAVMKDIARHAGVHIYDDDPAHAVFANRHFITICADANGGPARIGLPRASDVTDTATGAAVCRNASAFTLDLRPKEVRLLEVQPYPCPRVS